MLPGGPTPADGHRPPTVVRGDLPGKVLEAYRRSALVAWDIETSGLDWRSANIGTCQLFAQGLGVVIVSLDTDIRPENLVSLLEDHHVPKVFHHAPFDLRFMMHQWSVRPASIRCTKVASKLVDPAAPNETHSLQKLLARYVGVGLAKGAVRTSDWTTSQLSQEQVEYAAADVLYLPVLLSSLNKRLEDLGLGWLYDKCCDFLPARAALELGEYPDVFAY